MKALNAARRKIAGALETFFFSPASPAPLAALRIGVSVALILQWISVYPHFLELVGNGSLVQNPISRYFTDPGMPSALQLVSMLSTPAMTESAWLQLFFGAYGLSLVAFALGLFTRVTAVTTFVLNLFFYSAAPTTIYGADEFMRIALFYLAISPCGAMYSLDALRGTTGLASVRARFTLRALQLHLCIAYFASGLEKAVGPQWQSGEIIWRALMLPVYRQYDLAWVGGFPWLMKGLAWSTLLIEIGYPLFIWPKRTRLVWVASVTALHLGIGIFLGLWVFSLLMCALTLCAFGVSAQPAGEKATSTFSPPKSETPSRISAWMASAQARTMESPRP